MSLNNTWTPGAGATAEYMASAIPWVTSSVMVTQGYKEVNFNFVTKFFTIKNTAASTTTLSVAFASGGFTAANSNFFTLTGGQSFSGDLRVKSLFLSASQGVPSFELIAGLTRIPKHMFPVITGSFEGSSSFDGVG